MHVFAENITLIFLPIHLEMANDNSHTCKPTGAHRHMTSTHSERTELRSICEECCDIVALSNERASINTFQIYWQTRNTYRQHSSHGLRTNNAGQNRQFRASKSRTNNDNRNGGETETAFRVRFSCIGSDVDGRTLECSHQINSNSFNLFSKINFNLCHAWCACAASCAQDRVVFANQIELLHPTSHRFFFSLTQCCADCVQTTNSEGVASVDEFPFATRWHTMMMASQEHLPTWGAHNSMQLTSKWRWN